MTDREILDSILSKLEKLEGIESKVNSIESKVEGIESKVEGIESKVEGIESKVYSIESDVNNIKLTLENEIRPNIQRVAEGHLDLSRNLKEVVKTNNDYEILMIKVNTLESKVREIERKIS